MAQPQGDYRPWDAPTPCAARACTDRRPDRLWHRRGVHDRRTDGALATARLDVAAGVLDAGAGAAGEGRGGVRAARGPGVPAGRTAMGGREARARGAAFRGRPGHARAARPEW